MDNQEAKEKRNLSTILIIIFAVVIVTIAGTFAWLNYRSTRTAMSLVIGDIDGLSITLKPYQVNGSITPVSNYLDGQVINITADNEKSVDDDFSLYYEINTIDSNLRNQNFKYTVTRSTNNGSSYSVVKNGNFANATDNSEMEIYNDTVPANTTYLYKTYLWIDTNGGNQSSMQGKVFNGELRANVSSSSTTLFSTIIEDAVIDNTTSTYVSNSNGIQFDEISSNTNGKGLYLFSETQNDTYPIYYYRGAVTNNNVLFGGFCWKIVRTTDTGGIKLIYNGLPSGANSNQCTNTTGSSTMLASTSYFNSASDSPAYVGYMYGAAYIYLDKAMTSITDTYMYGTGYDETNHRLVTTNAMNFAGTAWGTYYEQLNNNHYTCFNTSGECNQVYYIYYADSDNAYYIQLPSGKTINQAVSEMLTTSSNVNNSAIKTTLDNWYQTNMTSQTSKLENTIWCNDRDISTLGGWDPDGGDVTSYLSFDVANRAYTYNPSLTCNINDAFTLTGNANGNGKLTYPVSLLTLDEIMLAGGVAWVDNETYYLYNNDEWWINSPSYFYQYSAVSFSFDSSGYFRDSSPDESLGVRPSVSLKHETVFSSGNGTANNPYVIN